MKGTCGGYNLSPVVFAVAGGNLHGDVEQAAEVWKAGVVSNEDTALGATFRGRARPEQTSAQILSFPAYGKVNKSGPWLLVDSSPVCGAPGASIPASV